MLASLATIMKQKLDVVTPLVYFAFTKYKFECQDFSSSFTSLLLPVCGTYRLLYPYLRLT